MNTPALRFGVICNGPSLQRWQHECINHLINSGNKLEVILQNRNQYKPASRWNKIFSSQLLYTLYQKLASMSRMKQQVSFAYPEGIQILNLESDRKGIYDHFNDESVKDLMDMNLDFILRFSFNIIKGTLLSSAKYGIWSFHHSDEKVFRGGPPVFWEIYNNIPVTGAILQQLTERIDGGKVLYKGYFKTELHKLPETLDEILEETATWPALVSKQIRSGTFIQSSPSDNYKAPMNKYPGNIQMALFTTRYFMNKLIKKFNNLFRAEYWGVYELNDSTSQINPLYLPSHRYFYADPFLLNDQEVILERFDHKKNIGELFSGDPASGKFRKVNIPLKEHASFPFIVKSQGNIYCIPETCSLNRAILFRYEGNKWIYISDLLKEVPAVDPSLYYYNSRWWLFITRKDRNPNLNLFIYSAEQIEGPYHPHLQNPVKTDIQTARNAGGIFILHGKMIRPVQDSSKGYGTAVHLMEITSLNEQEYQEKLVRTILPGDLGKQFEGIHHYHYAGLDRILIDLKMHRFNFHQFLRSIRQKLGIQ